MVAHGLVDLVSTDHHGIRRAGVSLLEAFEALAARGERELAERVLARAPGQVVRADLIDGSGRGRSALLGQPGSPDRLEQVAHRAGRLLTPGDAGGIHRRVDVAAQLAVLAGRRSRSSNWILPSTSL